MEMEMEMEVRKAICLFLWPVVKLARARGDTLKCDTCWGTQRQQQQQQPEIRSDKNIFPLFLYFFFLFQNNFDNKVVHFYWAQSYKSYKTFRRLFRRLTQSN